MHDINVGDTVYVNKRIVLGFNDCENFLLPQEVTRTTNTQFEAGGVRYNKKTLFEVGSQGYASKCHLEGKDQTKQMRELLANRKKVLELRDLVEDIQKKIRSGGFYLPPESIETVSQSITEFLKVEEDYGRYKN
jgi:hypothetical protein